MLGTSIFKLISAWLQEPRNIIFSYHIIFSLLILNYFNKILHICIIYVLMHIYLYAYIYIYKYIYLYTVVFQALSNVWLFMMQRTRLPCPQLSPGICSFSCPLSQWCYLTISSSSTPFPFAFNHSQYQGLFQWVGCMHQVAKVLELHLQHQTLQWRFRVLYIYIYEGESHSVMSDSLGTHGLHSPWNYTYIHI